MNTDTRVSSVWKLLRYSYGAVVLLAGLDKLLGTDLLANWAIYINPLVANMIPFGIDTFLVVIGTIEVIVGILAFTRWTRLISYVSVAWLVLIAINLLMLGYVDIAVRDLLLAVGAYATAMLAGIEGYSLTGKNAPSA